MAKQITQQTFDDVVKENMQEFDMSAEEAVEDAVKQFESQGVNLASIIKDTSLFATGEGDNSAIHPVVAALQRLSVSAPEGISPDWSSMTPDLEVVREECKIDLSHRCLAGKHEAYPVLMKLLERSEGDEKAMRSILQSLCALTNGQPDLLDEAGTALLIRYLTLYKDQREILALVVQLIRQFCIKHEANRQSFVSQGLIALLSGLLEAGQGQAEVVREVCSALRALTLDDDVRVPFGKAHENAKSIVNEGNALKAILNICHVYADNVSVLGELFLTLGSLVVRNEFCEEVLSLGGVQLILNAFNKNIAEKTIVRQALVVLRALAGSDKVKVAVVKQGGTELVIAAMMKHARNPAIAESACGTLAALTLRNPEHCNKVMECQGHCAVMQAMQIHPNEAAVQKQACMAFRNLVARTPEHSAAILELGVEDLLRKAGATHKDCDDEVKAALRDLGCSVQLQERWTGQKGALEQ